MTVARPIAPDSIDVIRQRIFNAVLHASALHDACKRGLAVAASACLGTAVVACSSVGGGEKSKDVHMGQQATLRSIGGSAIIGKVRVIDREDGATILVSAINFPFGPYRIAFHERGNCTSPNGFSAGAPWAPASTGRRPQDLVPLQYANSENRVEAELRVSKLHATGPDGVAGRSVVLYSGTEVPDIKPDVPNSAMACGVFEAARPPSFTF
jgi:Cu/Zn superoxide dismutase